MLHVPPFPVLFPLFFFLVVSKGKIWKWLKTEFLNNNSLWQPGANHIAAKMGRVGQAKWGLYRIPMT